MYLMQLGFAQPSHLSEECRPQVLACLECTSLCHREIGQQAVVSTFHRLKLDRDWLEESLERQGVLSVLDYEHHKHKDDG